MSKNSDIETAFEIDKKKYKEQIIELNKLKRENESLKIENDEIKKISIEKLKNKKYDEIKANQINKENKKSEENSDTITISGVKFKKRKTQVTDKEKLPHKIDNILNDGLNIPVEKYKKNQDVDEVYNVTGLLKDIEAEKKIYEDSSSSNISDVVLTRSENMKKTHKPYKKNMSSEDEINENTMMTIQTDDEINIIRKNLDYEWENIYKKMKGGCDDKKLIKRLKFITTTNVYLDNLKKKK